MEETIYYPLDEMTTMLIPVTSGCPYNRCAFCSMYQGVNYEVLPVREMERLLMVGDPYTEKVFLTGADPLDIGFEGLKTRLTLIRRYFPYGVRVASYGSVRSLAGYTVEELSELHDNGLRLLYIGFETGSDPLLRLMGKGHTVEEAVAQGKKLNRARLIFHSIVMYGIAGQGKGTENALATAGMLNRFVTPRVITMNLTVFYGTRLSAMVEEGRFTPAGRREKLEEIRTLTENLNPETPMLFDTTHPTNIIRIRGTLPAERDRLIREISKQLTMNPRRK